MRPEKWSAKIRRVVAGNPWFSVLEQDVVLPDGTEMLYHTIHFPRPAVGVVVRRGDEYLLIQQYRFIVEQFVWAIPSGGVNEDETLEDAARRELREETGYRAKTMRHVLGYFPSYGCGDQRFELFLAEDPELDGGTFDPHEVISTRWFSRSGVLDMIRQNGIVDGLSLTPLLLLLLQEERQRASAPVV